MVYRFDKYRNRNRREAHDSSSELPTMPCCLEAEEAVLGGLLFDGAALERVGQILAPEMFYLSSHQIIFGTIQELHAEGQLVELMTVSDRLTEREQLSAIGGRAKLCALFDCAVTTVNIDLYAELVVEKFKRRQLIATLQNLVQEALGPSPWEQLVATAEEQIFSLSDAARQQGPVPLSEFLTSELDRLSQLMQGNGGATGVSTGFYDLDALIKGLKPAGLYVLAGRPGMAKSSLAAAIARNVASQGEPVVLFSLEMSGGEIARRLLASESGVDSSRIEVGQVQQQEWEGVAGSLPVLSELPIFLDQSQDVTPSLVLSRSRFLKSKLGRLGLVVIDYLHLMLNGADEEVRELGRITRECKKLARALSVPVLLLSQLNRGVEGQANKRPSLASLRGSGSIEQDADLVAFLYRDEYYNPETQDRGIAEVIIAKNRNGPTGTVRLLFEPEFTRFRNISKPTWEVPN